MQVVSQRGQYTQSGITACQCSNNRKPKIDICVRGVYTCTEVLEPQDHSEIALTWQEGVLLYTCLSGQDRGAMVQ